MTDGTAPHPGGKVPDEPACSLYKVGLQLAGQHNHAGAAATLRQAAVTGHPDYGPRAAVGLGEALEALNDLTGAQAAYQQAIDSHHRDAAPDAATKLGNLRGDKFDDVVGAEAAYVIAAESGHDKWAPDATDALAGLRARRRGNWTLAIDFGTTGTVAAAADAQGRVDVVRFDDRVWMPSVVFVDADGTLRTGTAAYRSWQRRPQRFFSDAKYEVGQSNTGEEIVITVGEDGKYRAVRYSITAVVAAILRDGARTARARFANTFPARTVLTHPVDWSSKQTAILRAAAELAGLGSEQLVLMPEPEAAAYALDTPALAARSCVAVYDLGGGTCDVALLRKTGPRNFSRLDQAGSRTVGGNEFDKLLWAQLDRNGVGDGPAWTALQPPAPDRIQDPRGRARWDTARRMLLENLCAAKESLSNPEVSRVDVLVPNPVASDLPDELTIERAMLEHAIAAKVSETVSLLKDLCGANSAKSNGLDAIYLVGGSTKIPLVHQLLRDTFGTDAIAQYDDPQTVVARGAAAYGHAQQALVVPDQETDSSGFVLSRSRSAVLLGRCAPRAQARPLVRKRPRQHKGDKLPTNVNFSCDTPTNSGDRY